MASDEEAFDTNDLDFLELDQIGGSNNFAEDETEEEDRFGGELVRNLHLRWQGLWWRGIGCRHCWRNSGDLPVSSHSTLGGIGRCLLPFCIQRLVPLLRHAD